MSTKNTGIAKNKSTQPLTEKSLKIILAALVTIVVVLVICIVMIRIGASSTLPNDKIENTHSVIYYADPDKILQKVEHGSIYPVGIISNKDELEATIEEYSDPNNSYTNQYKEGLYLDIGDDFNDNNYLALGYTEYCDVDYYYNGLVENNNEITVYLVEDSHNGYCAITGHIIFIAIPKNITSLNQVSYNYDIVDNYDSSDMTVYKPIIYLYPDQEQELSVILGAPDRLTTTYPKYNNGWRVNAKPDGTLTDLNSGRELYSLYWEGVRNYTPSLSEGFVVKGEDSASFLEEKLDYLGLDQKEAEEFIVYWLPKLEASPYNLIKFEDSNTIENDMPLEIYSDGSQIIPDTTIRVLMMYRPLSEPIKIPEQELAPTSARTGFTVVEWGGTEL